MFCESGTICFAVYSLSEKNEIFSNDKFSLLIIFLVPFSPFCGV